MPQSIYHAKNIWQMLRKYKIITIQNLLYKVHFVVFLTSYATKESVHKFCVLCNNSFRQLFLLPYDCCVNVQCVWFMWNYVFNKNFCKFTWTFIARLYVEKMAYSSWYKFDAWIKHLNSNLFVALLDCVSKANKCHGAGIHHPSVVHPSSAKNIFSEKPSSKLTPNSMERWLSNISSTFFFVFKSLDFWILRSFFIHFR